MLVVLFIKGRQPEYVNQDDSNRRWFNEFRSKASSQPIALDTVDGNVKYCLLIVLFRKKHLLIAFEKIISHI